MLLESSQSTTILRVSSGAIANLAMNGKKKIPTNFFSYICATHIHLWHFSNDILQISLKPYAWNTEYVSRTMCYDKSNLI